MQSVTHPIKVVFFDIDDTLYYKKACRIPDSIFEQVIPQLRAKGIIPAIATGRTIGAFPNAIQPLMNAQGFELLVTANGQYNLYQQQVISEYPLSTERIHRAVTILQQLGIEYGFVAVDQVAVSKNTAEVEQALRPITETYIVEPDYYLKHHILQLLAFFPAERTPEVLAAGVLEQDLKQVRWHQYAVDLLKQENSKARGIQDVLRYFNIPIENAMAFGDGLNDIEMLSAVGCGVAMGNAEPELKAVADYVTLPIEQDGILAALKQLKVI